MLFLALACPYIDEAAVTARLDADADGVVAAPWGGLDCDDGDAQVRGPTTFYVDADGDGYGSTESVQACGESPGVTLDSSDCDDASAQVFPGAPERCASVGVDDDCDGLVDIDDDGVVDPITVYVDVDGDGFGRIGSGTLACDETGGPIVAGDCEDDEAAVYPGAVEVCLDGIDNDCDNNLDECTAGQIDTWIRPEGSGWGVGQRMVGGFDLNEDGVPDFALPAPYRVGAYILSADQIERGTNFNAASSQWIFETYRPSGGADLVVGPIGEFGAVGLVATSPTYDDSQGWGSSLLIVEDVPPAGAFEHDWVLKGEGTYDGLGSGLDGADADGDGNIDILAGAPYGDSGCGATYLFYTPFGEIGDSVDDFYSELSDARATRFGGTCNGATLDDNFGWSVAMLREGGEHGSVAISAPRSWDGSKMVGSVAIWHVGSETEDTVQTLDSAASLVFGERDYDHFGEALAVGDYNGDGADDLAVGAPYANGDVTEVGAVYLFSSAASLPVGTTRAVQADVIILGPDRASDDLNQVFGFSVALDGDMDNDGYDDLAIGAPDQAGLNDQFHAGAVWVCPGSTEVGSRSAGLTCSARINDEAPESHLGWAVEYAGDWDGDGRSELLIGMPGYTEGSENFGQVGVWYGVDL